MVVMLHKIFWVVARRRFLVYDRRFGTACLSHLQGVEEKDDGTDEWSRSVGHAPRDDAGLKPRRFYAT